MDQFVCYGEFQAVKEGHEPLSTKVVSINDTHHCILMKEEKVYSEMACNCKEDIRLCFREMLRWYDKMGIGPSSKMAYSSRFRGKNCEPPKGKIWKIK